MRDLKKIKSIIGMIFKVTLFEHKVSGNPKQFLSHDFLETRAAVVHIRLKSAVEIPFLSNYVPNGSSLQTIQKV